ncbi:MAG: hypothetical protein E6G67_03520 [Actinobacteria bacterium]|nr:MAG: hypothetical protein E6G67_03520 [Actinomycetota bacterium]
MTAHALAASAAGAAAGGLFGLAGAALRPLTGAPGRGQLGFLGAALLALAALELGRGRLLLPTVRRQVNEEWLHRYRGWVYGAGFGLQLGIGVATIVTAAAVYAALLCALLVASPALGAMIGGVFGAVRGLTPLAAARVRTPAQLVAVDAVLRRWERPARVISLAVETGIAAAALGLALA